jgi:hypothetical protein
LTAPEIRWARIAEAPTRNDLCFDLEIRRLRSACSFRCYRIRRPLHALHAEHRSDLAEPTDDEANIDWVRGFWQDMHRYSTGRLYLNFPGHGEGADLVRDAFGAKTYTRLARSSANTT